MICKYAIAIVITIVAFCSPAFAEKRVALVIGNGAYTNKAKLPNPANDAEDVAAALKRTNFEVIVGKDLQQGRMQELAIQFARAASDADVALFYYSGHAMQFNGVNYLMPIDAKLDDEADLKRFMRVDDVLSDLQQAKNLRILILDSCRDNPFAEGLKRTGTRSGYAGRGLSKMEAPLGTIISFSTQAGKTAEDGDGRNSPYTASFVKRIEEPKEIGDVFRDVGSDVYERSGKAQLPELSLSIVGKFYLNGPVSITVTPPAQSAPPDACASSEAHWKAVEGIGTVAAYEDHVTRFPNCAFSTLAKDKIKILKANVSLQPNPAGSPASSSPKTGTTKFDGEWDVNMTCPKAGNASVYNRYFVATVKDRAFHGEISKLGMPGWLVMDGMIASDGKATLIAKGLTANPATNLAGARPGTPYSFTVTAQFDDSSGSGRRNEDRPCTLTFARR